MSLQSSPQSNSDTNQSDDGFVQLGIFIDDLLKKANLWDVSEETRDMFRIQMFEQVIDRLGVITLQHMDGESLADYASRTKDKEMEPAELVQFYQDHIPNFVNIMHQAVEE